MFQVCKRAADSGDVVTQKQGLSIVGTRVPAIATTLSSFSCLHLRILSRGDPETGPYKNQILLGGRRQAAHRLLPHALNRIESAGS